MTSMRRFHLVALSLALIGAPLAAKPALQPPTIAAAVASPSRSAENVKLDESRKPVEVLSFLGLKRGMHVLDLVGGNRYWAEIIAPAVGAAGSETVWEPTQFSSDKTKTEFAAFAAKQPNASLILSPLEAPDFGRAKYDFAILNLNYHDLYVDFSKRGVPRFEPRQWLKTLYAAMKPGGIVGII